VSRRRDLVLLECANVLGGTANALVMVVVPWLILERTGSAATAGLAGALAAVPGIVVAPVVGVLVDRIGRRAISVASDLFSAVSVLMFPVLDSVGWLSVAMILGLTFLGAVFDPAGYTARKALIPDVADASGSTRDGVNGLHEGLFMGGWIVGPMLGALGIATVGSVATMWFACLAFVAAAGAVQLMRVANRAALAADAIVEESSWQSARAGLRVLVKDRPVWLLTLAITAIAFVYMPTESVLLPVHFEAEQQPQAFGLVLSALSAGAMLGAFSYGRVARRLSRRQLAVSIMLICAVAYLPIALLPRAALMLLPAFVVGLAWGPMEPLLNSLVQERFPGHQHGRVYGVQLSLFYAAAPLGQLVAGVAVEGFGVQPVLFAVAAGLLAVAVAAAVIPTLRGLDRHGSTPSVGRI
jgi:MFS family permease